MSLSSTYTQLPKFGSNNFTLISIIVSCACPCSLSTHIKWSTSSHYFWLSSHLLTSNPHNYHFSSHLDVASATSSSHFRSTPISHFCFAWVVKTKSDRSDRLMGQYIYRYGDIAELIGKTPALSVVSQAFARVGRAIGSRMILAFWTLPK